MTHAADVTYAVGDVHGHADLLIALQASIAADARRRGARAPEVVYLGDAVDRGPEPGKCIALQMTGLPGFSRVHLMGNHESLMLGFLDDPLGDEAGTWLFNGGEQTLTGFGVNHDGLGDIAGRADMVRDALELAIGPDRLAHLRSLASHHESDGAIFVHAGLRPGIALADQDPHDMMWIRGPFLESGQDFGKPVVHGHTPAPNGPEVRPNRINVDTCAYGTGFLTAAVLVPGEAPGFLVGARKRDWHLLVGAEMSGDGPWLDWALDCAAAAGVQAVGACGPGGARVAALSSARGLACRPTTVERIAGLLADPTSDLSRLVAADRAALCFSCDEARQGFKLALRRARMAAQGLAPTP